MSQPNQPPQNYEVNSPAIETLLRNQLPSVAGYGGLVRASNTIIPVLDVSAAAEGSSLPLNLQQSIAYGSMTAFETSNATETIANVAGFYRAVGVLCATDNVSNVACGFLMTDGSTPKQVFAHFGTGNAVDSVAVPFDLMFFLDSGISLQAFSEHAGDFVVGSIRQVATSDGTLVQPAGFS